MSLTYRETPSFVVRKAGDYYHNLDISYGDVEFSILLPPGALDDLREAANHGTET